MIYWSQGHHSRLPALCLVVRRHEILAPGMAVGALPPDDGMPWCLLCWLCRVKDCAEGLARSDHSLASVAKTPDD